MSIKVRYLSKDEIELEAELLLAQYAETIGGPVKLPVPVDEITKYHLALQLELPISTMFSMFPGSAIRPIFWGQFGSIRKLS